MALLLVIEDDVIVRTVITTALTRNGHKVVQAGDGRTGLTVAAEQPIDLIITDVMMPDRDGLEVIMELRAQKSRVPVIAMTGHPADSALYLKVAKSLGAERILTKPFTTADLLGAVADLLPQAS